VVKLLGLFKNLDLPPARIDIGKLTYEYHLEDNKYDARAIDKLKKTQNRFK
jgi:glyceraldehyde 3-phosphate dehydrogenase